MKNNKRIRLGHLCPAFNNFNLTFSCVFSAIYLIFAGILLIFRGTIYTYYWMLLPRGALSLWAFVLIFIVMFTFLGGILGIVAFYRERGCKKTKKYILLFLVFTTLFTVLWYDSIFSAHAFFAGFIFSSIAVASLLCSFVLSFKENKLIAVYIIPLFLWNIYIFWFSLCIMLIN